MSVQHSAEILSELYKKAWVWRAASLKSAQRTPSVQSVSSGFDPLDEALQGGWPSSGVVELNCQRLGTGELRLVFPVLSKLHQQGALQAWVNPPARLNAQALLSSELNLEHTIVVESRSQKDAYWSVDQLLRSGTCSALVFWCNNMSTAQAKRLQVQAKQHGTLVFAIRLNARGMRVQQSLPVSVRMQLRPCPQGLWVDIFKRQNAWPVKPFELSMDQRWPLLIKTPNTLKQLNQRFAEEALGSVEQSDAMPADSNVVPFPLAESSPSSAQFRS